MTRYLIVCATEAEAKYVPTDLTYVVTGVGKTAAATATARALAGDRRRDLAVVNIGSAGALRPGLTGLYTPGSALNHDINAEAIRAIGLDPAERVAIDGGDETVLATGDVFVNDPAVRDKLAERAHLVDMEGYAVAYACRQFDVPVRLVKHVSDSADEQAMDWPDLVDHSARILGEWLQTQLRH